jgi:hypothetical protein
MDPENQPRKSNGKKRAKWRLKTKEQRAHALIEKHHLLSRQQNAAISAVDLPHSKSAYIGLTTKEYTYRPEEQQLKQILRNPK